MSVGLGAALRLAVSIWWARLSLCLVCIDNYPAISRTTRKYDTLIRT